ncbi:MAG: hypothetical protein ACI9C1_002697 [Candidatus Aldehydirespiratoraceae bacterium]|jgi:hypothetical protein
MATQPLVAAQRQSEDVAAGWAEAEAWVVRDEIAEGATISAAAVARLPVPHLLHPADAMTESPIGHTSGVRLVAGEIVRATDLATMPHGTGAIELQVPARHLTVGDTVDLYDLLSGDPVATGATVIELHDQLPTIAIATAEVSAVVRSLTNGEVVPVLVN